MSLTQPNLHKFFKVKKQNLNSFTKDGITKGENYKDVKIQSLETFEKKLDEKVNDIVETKPQTFLCKVEEKPLETAECTILPDTKEGTEVQTPEEENSSKECENKVSQLLTPPVKQDQSEGPSRKRKREQEHDLNNEASSAKTPKKNEGVLFYGTDVERPQVSTPVAKKRLILSKEDTEGQETSKPIDPMTMKEKLGKCGRLDELQARLLKIKQCEKKLQAFKSQSYRIGSPKKQNLKPSSSLSYKTSKISPYNSPLKDKKTNSPHRYKNFSSLDIEVPLTPSKSPSKPGTPTKYAYERFKHLADPSAVQLHLPYRYQMIKEVFRAVDTVVSILHNRQEIITYSKLKPAVQEMLRKTFSETHLGQLKAVFPLAYFFTQEKLRGASYNCKGLQLTVKPNFDYKTEKKGCSRNLMNELSSSNKVPTLKFRKMDSVVLVERREIFHMSLLDIVKKRHTKFLASLNPPIVIDDSIRRWHPDFPIEDLSPPPPADLPQPPKSDVTDSAKNVLDKARELFSVNNRMKDVIDTVSKSSTLSTPSVLSSAVKENKEISACLKGISSSLLEKIRAREAAKAAREMTRSSSSSQELETLSRLPELVRILRSLFVMEKKAALPWESVMTKVVSSHSGSLSVGEVEKHVNMLMKEVPGWCTSHNVRSGLYLKVDKSRQISDVIEKLNQVIKSKQ